MLRVVTFCIFLTGYLTQLGRLLVIVAPWTESVLKFVVEKGIRRPKTFEVTDV